MTKARWPAKNYDPHSPLGRKEIDDDVAARLCETPQSRGEIVDELPGMLAEWAGFALKRLQRRGVAARMGERGQTQWTKVGG